MMKEVLFRNRWLNVVRLNDWYICTDEVRTNNNDFVCVLPWRWTGNTGEREFLLRHEHNPAHGDPEGEQGLSCITGQCETGDVLHHAHEELKEEGGYSIDSNCFVELGFCRPLKSSMAKIWLYEVHVTSIDKQHKASGDGTMGEEGAYPVWVSREAVVSCKDPYIQTALIRLEENDKL